MSDEIKVSPSFVPITKGLSFLVTINVSGAFLLITSKA